MRYDHTVPVSVELLKRLFKHQKDNVFTRFVPDRFHPKVIWWKGYGAYIGSANHTDNGWLTNIEAGVFLTADELLANGMDNQLEDLFDYLRELEVTIPISADYIAEMERFNLWNKGIYDESRKKRSHPEWEGPSFVQEKAAFDRRKDNFKQELLETLGILQSIQQQLVDYRPKWVSADVPSAWHVDQFLHGYYYNHVGDAQRKPYEDFHEHHRPTRRLHWRLNLGGGSLCRRRHRTKTTRFMRVHRRCVSCWRRTRCSNYLVRNSPSCAATPTPPWST
ncbi:phospholipase D family protein [Pseudomonas sp. Irchel 3E20]|uniref:phospholipase D family protein n=1 Tax=Pseudomonas sp. Irchel 3E20 TaxID=2008983 RepID=UPI002115CA91|nr:phospholipase D family protein [Pseudomonas sp. Irchel 3E20]